MKPEGAFDGIRKLGFRRWYERQLIESHLWLATCFVSMILVAAGLELLTLEDGARDFAFDAALIVGGCVLGWVSWRRYARTMLRAEAIGEQAVCVACQHYGFRVVGVERGRMRARCPKCGNQWELDDPSAAGAGADG
ncbi:MAG: hypothetical protein EHM83_03680 [Burkholderiales bacterium]|nr:MAG: hypothetical protein EHM83_03680 [Burkholderiales bacterium]